MTNHGLIYDDLDDLRREMCAKYDDCEYCVFDGKTYCKLSSVLDALENLMDREDLE